MLVLTSVLALIAFQFVMNDNLPRTGYQTRLHRFIMFANVLIALAGLESVTVYYMATAHSGNATSAGTGTSKMQKRWRNLSRLVNPAARVTVANDEEEDNAANRVEAYRVDEGGESAGETRPRRPPLPLVRKNTIAKGLMDRVANNVLSKRVHQLDLVFASLFPIVILVGYLGIVNSGVM